LNNDLNALLRLADAEVPTARYAKCIEASRRARWEIDRDVIRDRQFDFDRRFLPDGLSLVHQLGFLTPHEQRFLSQIQGRTYANMFGLVERFIGVKTLELGGRHGMGDQVAMEALVRMTDEELKHQELFRRLERMMAAGMPPGYAFLPQSNDVASLVLAKGDWAVLGLTLHIELFTLAHYRSSIEADGELSELWRDVFRFHWMEESQHAVLDELEWRREHQRASAGERDRGVGEFIELVGAVDGMLAQQASQDVDYFVIHAGRASWHGDQLRQLQDAVLRAYRWQYIVSGAQEPRFASVLADLTTEAQMRSVLGALGPIVTHVGHTGAAAH
jgi:hypothetical protein